MKAETEEASRRSEAQDDSTHQRAQGTRPVHSNPIVAALHEMASSALSEQLREMFEKADDILFDSAEKARNGTEQQLYYDTMRTVRMQRAKIMTTFRASLQEALLKISKDDTDPAAPGDTNEMKLMDREAVEELIAVRNMETKATTLHSHELVELQRRLSRLADMTGGGLSPEAMSPARIIKAFQNSIQGLSVEFPIKLVIFKLFDRLVVGRMSEVIASANQLLARHGVEQKLEHKPMKPPMARPSRLKGPQGAPAAGAPAPAWAAAIDSAAFDQAMGLGFGMPPQAPTFAPGSHGGTAVAESPNPGWGWAPQQSGTAGQMPSNYSDATLVRDVSNILASLADGRWPQTPNWLPAPNVALVARMFDAYYRDPRLTDKAKPMMGRMQLPIIKSALADPKFFTDPNHPARRSANDLFEILLQFSAAGATASPQAYGELDELVRSMVETLDVDPNKLRNVETAPVDDVTADSFLRDQEEHLQQRNRAKVERLRRMVAHELRGRIGNRQLPKGVMRLMLSGFGPLLTLDYIRHGFGGHSWNQTMELVDGVLNSLEPQSGAAEDRAAREAEVVAGITRRLSNIGFSESKLQEVISGLLQAYLDRSDRKSDEDIVVSDAPAANADSSSVVPGDLPQAAGEAAQVDHSATATTVPPPDLSATVKMNAPLKMAAPLTPDQELHQLLFIILVPGVWCTVLDPTAGKKYWVRVKSYYPTHNSMVLSHYMEERYLSLRATSFATDLVEGRASVIDPSPELQDAIARIGEIPFKRETEALVWTTPNAPVVTAA